MKEIIKMSAKKIGKVQSKRSKKKTNPEINIKRWVIVLIITVFITMWIYGMTAHYFPTPIHVGLGQYFDISAGVVIIGLLFSGFIIAIILKKKK